MKGMTKVLFKIGHAILDLRIGLCDIDIWFLENTKRKN